MSFFGGLFSDVESAVTNFTKNVTNTVSNITQQATKDLKNVGNTVAHDVQTGLASAYHATRAGLTTLFTYSGALGRETGDLIKYHHFVPFSQAVKQVQNQSVANTPVFAPLAKFGIKTGSQLFNAESQFAANIIPITGTFGHLAAHPGESLGSKISDIAFGIADLLPVADVAADFLRPADVGAEALAGARAVETGGEEAGSDLFNPLSKDLGKETQAGRELGGFDFGGGFRRPPKAVMGRIFSPGEEAGSDLFNPLAKEGEEIGSDLENPLAKDLEKGARLRNTLLKISKYGTIGAIGIGIGVPLGLSIFGGKGGNNQAQTQATQNAQNLPIPSSPSSPYNFPNPNSPPVKLPKITIQNPSSPYNLSTGVTGLYNPFANGEQAQEAGTALQNQSTAASTNAPGAVPGNPSSPSTIAGIVPSSPSSPSSGGFLTSLFHNKFFLIGIIVIILIVIGIIIMR